MAQGAQQEEQLMDIRVAESSAAYKFYLNQEKKILGGTAVILFLLTWETIGNWAGLINPMFMSAPSLVGKAAWQMFASGEIYNDLYISGIEFFWGYIPVGHFCDPLRHRHRLVQALRIRLRSLCQRHECHTTRCLVTTGHHLAGHRHLVQGRHHLSGRGVSAADQHP